MNATQATTSTPSTDRSSARHLATPAPDPEGPATRRGRAPVRRRPATDRRGAGPLASAEDAFVALCTGPRPLAVDGRRVPGLPGRVLALTEVRELLLDPETGHPARRAVWAQVVTRAQAGRPEWVVAAVGLAMPGLAGMAARLRTATDADGADLEAELLTGFLTALKNLDPERGRVAARLCWAAYRSADAYRRAQPARSGRPAPLPTSVAPPRPYGHPDLVLADLVTRGVLSAYEAELIACTRLEGALLDHLSAAWRVPLSTLSRDRADAERRVRAALTTDGKVTVRSQTGPGVEPGRPEPACPGARPSCPPTGTGQAPDTTPVVPAA